MYENELTGACMLNDVKKLQELITSGHDPNEIDYFGITPIENASTWGSIDCLLLLLNMDIPVEHPAKLIYALNMGYNVNFPAVADNIDNVTHIVQSILINNTIDVNKRISAHHNYSLLGSACVSGFYEIAKILLEHGADPDSTDFTICHPLMLAVTNGFCDITRLLLMYGARPTLKKQNVSVLHASVTNNSIYTESLYDIGEQTHMLSISDAHTVPNFYNNMYNFLLLLQYGARDVIPRRAVDYISKYTHKLTEQHKQLFTDIAAQEKTAKLFERIKERIIWHKIKHCSWYQKAMENHYKPGGIGYHKTMNELDELINGL